ncbi:fumarate hydratase, partial [Singulisphaera rosea]
MPEFAYQAPFPLGPDSTRYRHLSSDHVSASTFEGQEILKVAPEGLSVLAREAFRDVSFLYRESHLAKVAAI